MVVQSKKCPIHNLYTSFSALSVEPYGGSPVMARVRSRQMSFSALSVEPYGGSWLRREQRG